MTYIPFRPNIVWTLVLTVFLGMAVSINSRESANDPLLSSGGTTGGFVFEGRTSGGGATAGSAHEGRSSGGGGGGH